MKNSLFWSGLLFLFVLTVFGSCKKDDNTSFDKYTEELDKLTDSVLTKLTFDGRTIPLPGLIVGVWAPGQNLTYLKAKGYANLAFHRPMQVTDLFKIGSLTKTFTATILLQMVDDGLISLNDTIENYIPGIPNGEIMTIRQLLAMQSGLFEVNNDSAVRSVFINEPDHQFSTNELLDAIKRHPATFKPGENTEYCNSNYIIAGILIEQLSGKSFEECLDERIVQPLALTNTSFLDSRWMPEGKPYASGYTLDSNYDYQDITERYNLSLAYSAGAMLSDMDNVKKWVTNFTSGTLISSAMLAEMESYHPIFDNSAEYGLGLMRFGGNFLGHTGDVPGCHSIMAQDKERDITIIIFINCDTYPPRSVFYDVISILDL